jgi:hypothetical protein
MANDKVLLIEVIIYRTTPCVYVKRRDTVNWGNLQHIDLIESVYMSENVLPRNIHMKYSMGYIRG